jgi:DNA invertase Pin-like site-specific DNA recombinase
MSSRGDKTVTWDAEKVDLGDAEAMAAIHEAERIFNEERARGATAFKVEPGKPAERLDNFDKTAEQTVIVPRIAGG